MKKILLTALLAASAGVFAQSKTTGTVTLVTGMTAKLDLNNDTSTATLTLTGPQDRWLALQFGSFANGGGMQSGQDVVYYNGTTLVDANHNGIGAAPSTDTNDWTVTSNTTSGSTRTIVATRAFMGGSGDFTFNYDDANIDFAWAKAASASFVMSNHGSNRGYKLNQAFSCMAPDAPTASAQSFCQGATVAQLTATGGNGASFSWYTNATGGSALSAATALASGTYYVSQTQSACESARTAVAVTVNNPTQPAAPANQSFCDGATVANLQATGNTIKWYTTIGDTPLESFHFINTGTYYVTQTQGNCESAPLTVNVTLNAIPTAPGGATSQSFTAGETVSDLEISVLIGAQITWYILDEDVYIATAANTPLVNGTTYYVTQRLNGCESGFTGITANIAAATESFTLGGLKVYPNPVSDVFSISANTNLNAVEVYNLLGQTVLTQKVSGNAVQVSAASLTAGTYIVKVTGEAGTTATVRIAKQ